jgi:chaperone required for assembly of F1-ATPase
MRIWGADAEALARRERRWLDMKAATDLLAALQD